MCQCYEGRSYQGADPPLACETIQGLQEKLLDAAADQGAGTELPWSHREQSPVNEDRAQDLSPVQTAKRRLDATSESGQLPAKRARLAQTDSQRPQVGETAEQADKATLQQPKPNPPKLPSFLKDFVDPVYPHPRPESLYASVSEWLESVGSHREKRCRSESHFHRLGKDPVSRQLARSAPEMGCTQDADGFVVPPTPASTGSRSYQADADAGSVVPLDVPSSSRSAGRSLVEDTFYRSRNLAVNGIYLRSSCEQFPEHIAGLIDYVRKDRDSPGPTLDQVWQDVSLEQLEMGAGEPQVEKYFQSTVFYDPQLGDDLDRSDRQPMSRYAVPTTGSKLRVSNPIPDTLYGYNNGAFPRQQTQLISMGTDMSANNQGLLYPFFAIDFKGDGSGGTGSLWVATNQCLGSSTSCVNIAERLNRHLRDCKSDEIQSINSAAFSVAMNGIEARLYISWKHNDLDYYMRRVKSFLLQEPEHYIEFRKYVRNIIDWGKDKRFNEIRASLDKLLEEGRKRTSEAAKSCQPPPDGSATRNGKKHKSSSSRRNSSRSDSVPTSHVGVDVNADDYTHGADEEPTCAGYLWFCQDQS